MPKTVIVIMMLTLAGCGSLLPSERQQSASVKATEALATAQSLTIQRALSTGPEQASRVTRDGVVITTPIHEDLSIHSTTSNQAGSHSTESASLIESIPMGVKIALVAVGLGLLWLVVWLWRRSSASFNAAFTLGDKALAGLADQVSHIYKLAAPDAKETVSTILTSIEKARGKINSEAP